MFAAIDAFKEAHTFCLIFGFFFQMTKWKIGHRMERFQVFESAFFHKMKNTVFFYYKI